MSHRFFRPSVYALSALIILLVCAMLFFSAGAETVRYDQSFFDVFDTFSRISIYSNDQQKAADWLAFAYNELLTYHKLYDIYNEYDGMTNLCTLNRTAAKAPVEVDDRILALLRYSKDMYALTDGRTNIAMGSVLSLWHDARTAGISNPETAALPDMAALEEAAKHTSIEALVIDEQSKTVYFADPDLKLDVGAIAKGYATEQVAQVLMERGVDSALLSIGGNIRAIGIRGDGQVYHAAVQNPDLSDENQTLLVLPLNGQSLVTSGSYQRFYVVDGKEYHHIIDPDTLMPAEYLWSVTILTVDAGLADSLSTALFTMPLEEGQAFVASRDDVEAVWVLHDGTIVTSGGVAQ